MTTTDHQKQTSCLSKLLSEEQNKNEYLFHSLSQTYARIYFFNQSFLGRLFIFIQHIYLLLTLRWNKKTDLMLLYESSLAFSKKYQTDFSEFSPPPTRIGLAKKILSYLIRHPYSSLRLISFYRIKKLLTMLRVGSTDSAVIAWINGRFPTDTNTSQTPIIFELNSLLDKKNIEFTSFKNIEVSIVIPVYNQYRMTISCLSALKEHTFGINYEIIIADDCSTDLTKNIAEKVNNILVIRNRENLGFLKNCNNAISQARGEYIIILNNDTNVQAGWLSPLLDVFKQDRRAGLVGAKLLFKKGSLQEAGGIIWKDGTGWNYGRGANPQSPEFNYLKEVDYISGACIVLKKTLWDSLNGFDERFCPAYYEDTDLAFRVRAAGYKVLYQPKSLIVHMEGITHGSNIETGIKKYQQINCQVFWSKWQKELNKNHFKHGDCVFKARDRSRNKTTVLIIDQYVPFYDKDAGSRSTFLYIKSMLNLGINVKFLGANFFPHEPYTEILQQMGVEVLYGEIYAKNWKKWLDDNTKYIDVIYLHRPHITEHFIDEIITLKKRPKLIYFGHDLHHVRIARRAILNNDTQLLEESDNWKQRELKIFKKVDKIYYPSQTEVDIIHKENPLLDVRAIPLYTINSPDPESYDHGSRSGLIFVGGFNHPPNLDAIEWFVHDILPIIHKHCEEAIFHIVGSNVPDKIKALENKLINVHGFLTDEALYQLYQSVRICVVPLRYGAGVKGKILEAIQQVLPLVTTSIGAEGLPDAQKIMQVKDTPEQFAKATINLYTQPALVTEHIKHYHSYVEKHFSQKQIEKIIKDDFICH
ncbi:MAG: hypothetical protein CSA09_03615 [Candidatus Contendobacter odensis]|uniref:Glycosyltransferase 2-like domain-containing protein n=1 Tax=Candidatus Contendibacter odensensis TaxID=1400860 RepID=A0A2G6PF20_9GAMM|nr:MAG: hypothetical protein CSA09_03615 [Candidatus Contendobacter odensis]